MKLQLEPVIGLEIHLQLSTRTKMFCACENRNEAFPPNTAVCEICLGHPGTLPTPNEAAVKSAIKLGLAFNAIIAPRLKFDRKHYFYPDLPKGYQVSQFDEPICGEGFFDTIRIERAHLEEDSAKSLHTGGGETLIDFNRGGSPLIETVTRPDFKTPAQARAFLQELRLLVRALGISDGDMEKGHLRCDANISLRPVGEIMLYPKTEIKNINSFRSVERALEFEIARQTGLWESEGGAPTQTTTRNWDDVAQKTTESRTKEAAHDYRFFPEPDLPPFDLAALIEEVRHTMPELPAARRARFQNEYGFTAADAAQLIEHEELAIFAEHVMSEFFEWVRSVDPDVDEALLRVKAAKLLAGWLLSKYLGALGEANLLFTQNIVTAENFAEFLTLVYQNKINSTSAQQLLKKMIATGGDPSQLLESENLSAADSAQIALWVDEVIATNSLQTAQFKAGKETVLQFLVGQVMKKSRGTADAEIVAELLRTKLS